MTGLICVPCRPDQARHLEFYQSLFALQKPEGWEVRLYPGFFAHDNRNLGVLDALEGGADWLFILEDDVLMDPDGLLRLLSHQRPIVTALHLAKENPWPPYLFDLVTDGEDGERALLAMALEERRGLCPVDATGLGACLIRTDVFRAIPHPWFNVSTQWRTDDLYFSHAVQGKFEIVCDLDVSVGHILIGSVWARQHGTGWETGLKIGVNAELRMPAAKPSALMAALRAQQAEIAAMRR